MEDREARPRFFLIFVAGVTVVTVSRLVFGPSKTRSLLLVQTSFLVSLSRKLNSLLFLSHPLIITFKLQTKPPSLFYLFISGEIQPSASPHTISQGSSTLQVRFTCYPHILDLVLRRGYSFRLTCPFLSHDHSPRSPDWTAP